MEGHEVSVRRHRPRQLRVDRHLPAENHGGQPVASTGCPATLIPRWQFDDDRPQLQ